MLIPFVCLQVGKQSSAAVSACTNEVIRLGKCRADLKTRATGSQGLHFTFRTTVEWLSAVQRLRGRWRKGVVEPNPKWSQMM